MPTRQQRTSARLLAPLALAACGVAVLVVIAASLGGGGDSPNGSVAAPEATDETTAGTVAAPEPRQPAAYTVEPGDTLGGISEETGVPVETIQELNPELDPQALIAGQKIKLRE